MWLHFFIAAQIAQVAHNAIQIGWAALKKYRLSVKSLPTVSIKVLSSRQQFDNILREWWTSGI